MGKDFSDPTEHGIFADSVALNHLHSIDSQISEDFLVLTRSCEGCSTLKQCFVPWAEVYCLANGVPPHKVGQAIRRPDVFPTVWSYLPKGKCYHPNYRCECANRPFVVFNLTPNECEVKLRNAAKNGVVSEEQQNLIKAIQQVVAQLRPRTRG